MSRAFPQSRCDETSTCGVAGEKLPGLADVAKVVVGLATAAEDVGDHGQGRITSHPHSMHRVKQLSRRHPL